MNLQHHGELPFNLERVCWVNYLQIVTTRTVAGKVLQSSYWPTILRSDAARNHAVRKPIMFTALAIPLVAILTAVAGVVTPLGLYEETGTHGAIPGSFEYVQDAGPYFDGTSPRKGRKFARTCLFQRNTGVCPFTGDTVIFTKNSSTDTWNFPDGVTTDVAPLVREVYSSGTTGVATTVSNFFDIEWRQLTMVSEDTLNNGSEYAVGIYRQLDSLLLWDAYRNVEGLVVDAKDGGIGFRNHTIPTGLSRNATWKEDLLFVEPETVCVDTNLTFDFRITSRTTINNTSNFVGYRLTDRGGFANLDHEYPYYDLSNPQKNPDLWGRAYKAAMINNFYSMVYFNLTPPSNQTEGVKAFDYMTAEVGKSYSLATPAGMSIASLGVDITTEYGGYLFQSSSLSSDNSTKHPNPWNVTQSEWFSDIQLICNGAGSGDYANISNIHVGCGLVRGVPIRTDGGPKAIFDDGSEWSIPLYSCATASRATIKTVEFLVTGGGGLPSLQVKSIAPKEYKSEDDHPIWGMEDSGMRITEIPTIWGLVSEKYAKYPNVSTIKQPSFYIPGYAGDGAFATGSGVFFGPPDTLSQNLPGHDFPVMVSNTIYQSDSISGIMSDSWPVDMVGRGTLGLYARWSDLSRNASSVGTIIDLIWTDLAASGVVGTKGVLGPGNDAAAAVEAKEAPVVMIQPSIRRIRYHLAFGIPAFLLLLVIVLISCLAVFSFVTHMSTLSVLKLRIQQLSVGRVFTTVLYPEGSNFTMSPREWSRASGKRTVTLDGVQPPGMGNGYAQPHVIVDGEAVTQVTPLNYHMNGDKSPI